MPQILVFILTSLISSVIARVLLGAGFTVITYKWVEEILDDLVTEAQNSINDFPEFALSIFKLWQLDICISMLLSTVQLIIFIKIAKIYLGKPS